MTWPICVPTNYRNKDCPSFLVLHVLAQRPIAPKHQIKSSLSKFILKQTKLLIVLLWNLINTMLSHYYPNKHHHKSGFCHIFVWCYTLRCHHTTCIIDSASLPVWHRICYIYDPVHNVISVPQPTRVIVCNPGHNDFIGVKCVLHRRTGLSIINKSLLMTYVTISITCTKHA